MCWAAKMLGQTPIKLKVCDIPRETDNEEPELQSAKCAKQEAGTDQLALTVPCHREGCNGTEAFFNQVQIRSADEPMTMFYRVRQ